MPSHRPKVAINGFGRIGRAFARLRASDRNCPFDLVACNDLADPKALAYLLELDTVHRAAAQPVTLADNTLSIGDVVMRVLAERDPAALPWAELNVDLVVESTGHFRAKSKAAKHLTAGAKRVVLSAPGDGNDPPDVTVVAGINHDDIEPSHTVISAASCTTTCLAPVAKVLHETFGIRSGTMTTIHAYTADQALVDSVHKDFRRGRAAGANIVPTSTGAAKAIGLVVPNVAGKLHGIAVRVPVPDVSLIDLTIHTEKPVTAELANAALANAAAEMMPGTLRIESRPVVSSDLMGESAGSVIDAALTASPGDNMLQVVSWYDNEWSYASRLYALVRYLLTDGGDK